MNERRIIETLREKYPVRDGSKTCEITPGAQKARNVAGRLLIHAQSKGRRKRGKWVESN